ncbi:transcriptional regulator [Nocardioides sp. GCM10027113]|uniref:transcriptional regulator n=1 Tax=unclassified Nocardioides TaxID=2615069 RepID=UPI003617722C
MTTARDELQARRVAAVRAWTSFVESGDDTRVRPEILRSWRLSEGVAPDVDAAPLADEADTTTRWHDTPLQRAVEAVEGELRRTAEDGDLVIAVTDAETRILWTYGGRVMRRKAETVNFVPAGRWDEASVGTNALAISSRTGEPSMVFSAEHYAEMVHNWVCWAAPLHDPVSGEQIGVIDLSTTWDRTHPIGLATARVMARLIETAMPRSDTWTRGWPGGRVVTDCPGPEDPGLVLSVLGTAEAWLDGARLLLNRRQTEILTLLTVHPEGLSVEQLHALLYGDHAVTLSTLKAEVSHLRHALGGQLASRPYRLTLPVRTDVEDVLALLGRGRVREAVAAYGGDLLPGTDAPALVELAEYLAVSVREALLADPDPQAVLRYSELAPYDAAVIEACLAGLAGRPHPAAPLLKGRLAVARR